MEEVAEGVFTRHPDGPAQDGQGELVQRLMEKIATLEAQLYEHELRSGDLIPAGRGAGACMRAMLDPG
jgi:hypothetical protein